MLVKLLPDQVSDHWDEISVAIRQALPPFAASSDRYMVNILKSILEGSMQCWILYSSDSNTARIYAILTTTVEIDKMSDTRCLLIYSFYANKPLTNHLMISCFETLKKFASSKRCYKMIAYTNIPKMERLWESLGGIVETKLMEVSV